MRHRKIDVLREVSPPQFARLYALKQPVIISDHIAHWPATQRWNPSYLASRYGDSNVILAEYNPKAQSTFLAQTLADRHRSVSLKSYLRSLESNDHRYALREDTSMFQQSPELLDELGWFFPFLSDRAALGTKYAALWIGPPDYVTGLHVDPGDTLLFQIYGRKQVLLLSAEQTSLVYEEDDVQRREKFGKVFPGHRFKTSELRLLRDWVRWSEVEPFEPDLDRFPQFARAEIVEACIGPGDTLYIPDGWWHAVRSLDASISVSIEPEFNGLLFNGGSQSNDNRQTHTHP